MENEVKKQKGYVMGIIGAILGGLIATIPWALVYVYGNMMLSLLAVIIAAGEFLGYQCFKGKIDNKLPVILMVLAIIIVTIVTLVVIPAMLLNKEGLTISLNAIKNLYSYNDFSSAIFRDYIISVAFTILGASVVTSSIKKQLLNNENPKDIKLNLLNNEEQNKLKQDAINLIKPVFERYSATDENNTMTKEELFAEIENQNKTTYFNYLKNLNIIKREKGKYYYCAENELNTKVQHSVGKACVIAIAIVAIIAIVSLIFDGKTQTTNTIWNDDVSFKISSSWEVYQDYTDEYGWTYFRYISELPSNSNTEATNEIDFSQYPATISVAYDKESTGLYESVDSLKEILDTYVKEELQPEEYFIETTTTEKGYEAVRARIEYTSYPAEIDYYYYIYKDGKLCYITAVTYNTNDDDILNKEILDIANSFEWSK